VKKHVKSDSKVNQWNLNHGGHSGMIIGYTAYYLNSQSIETAKEWAEAMGAFDLTDSEAREAVGYAFARADDRDLSGSM
jgi:hypothetical protein